jgi:hypothetical protein
MIKKRQLFTILSVEELELLRVNHVHLLQV